MGRVDPLPSPEPVLVDVPELLEVPEFVVVDVPELLEVPEFVVVEVAVLLEEPEFVDVEVVPDTVESVRSHFGLVKLGSQLQMQKPATSMEVPWLLQRASRVQAADERTELPA